MADREADVYRQSLENERRHLLGSIAACYDHARESAEAGNDFADNGSEACEKAKCLGLARSLEFTLQQVEFALQRLEERTYGFCELCGEPISRARLEALPRTTLCIACKVKQGRGNHKRRVS